jgi:hypothetical protein
MENNIVKINEKLSSLSETSSQSLLQKLNSIWTNSLLMLEIL